ncbi:Protein CBFA2T2 [Orchesella cincta]|uniref:Protein CBFA2T2 n=1 Tax=Orchesella cincta TaxID=48709 RepID=A0A1D2N515_ORCCI|nr:Protein CBFA2T2 [Orchesella cincta]
MYACWNCGRKAHETCSGCNMARYCSSFCQHKDWENHHTVCGRVGPSSSSERASVAPADSKSSSHHARENSNSPSNVRNSTPPQDHSPGSTN